MDLTSSHELIKYGTYSPMKWEPGFLKLKSIIDRVKIVLIPYAKLINRIWAIYKTKYLECPNFKTEFLNSLNYIPNIPSLINPFHATDLFWYPLKTSEIHWVFRGYQKRSVAWNGLKNQRKNILQKFVKARQDNQNTQLCYLPHKAHSIFNPIFSCWNIYFTSFMFI